MASVPPVQAGLVKVYWLTKSQILVEEGILPTFRCKAFAIIGVAIYTAVGFAVARFEKNELRPCLSALPGHSLVNCPELECQGGT